MTKMRKTNEPPFQVIDGQDVCQYKHNMRTEFQNVIDKIKNRIETGKLEDEYVSPNYVEDISIKMGITLTREEVVYISNNIEKL